ncbi:hypothetical protein ACFL5F_04785 [Planctomycetota bacterium]
MFDKIEADCKQYELIIERNLIMSMLRPMRDELSKYRRRKRRPMEGSIPGAPYNSYRKSRRYVSGLSYVPRGPNHHHNLYNWGVPREYHPNLNAPAAQSEEYWPNENWESHMIPHSTNPKLFRPFPDLPPAEENITYEKSKTKSEFFLKLMEVMYRPFEEGQEIPSSVDIWREHFRDDELDMYDLYMPNADMTTDTAAELTPEDKVRKFVDVIGALAHLQTVFPKDHPDIVNLRAAWHDISNDPETMSELESIVGDVGPSKLGTGDPYAIDAFDEPMFETAEPHAPDMFDEQSEMMFEQLPEESFPETESLERIVEQEGSFGAPAPAFMEQDMMPDEMMADMSMSGAMPEMTVFDIDPAIDEINQAIDEVSQQPMPEEMEPDPFQPQFDPYMMGQNVFDQMQYLANPFAMPDPYGPMGLGPMGPMPGPMPGP